MTYVVTDACIRCKYMDCVEVCPVDCFYEGDNMLVINPSECIDCGVCEPECPAEAILPDTESGLEQWLEVNTTFSAQWPNITRKREAHQSRATIGRRSFVLDFSKAISMGLTGPSYDRLLRLAGFNAIVPPVLPEGAFGPPIPVRWRWRPSRQPAQPPAVAVQPPRHSAFAVLSDLVR